MEIKWCGGVIIVWYGGGRNDVGCFMMLQRMNWIVVFVGVFICWSIYVIVGVFGVCVWWDNFGGLIMELQ